MARSTVSDASRRYAILGATNFTNIEAGVSAQVIGTLQFGESDVIVRWVDASNHARLTLVTAGGTTGTLKIEVVVAAAVVATTSIVVTRNPNTWYGLRLVAYASGVAYGALLDANGGTLATLRLQSSALATGGALATGKPGFADMNTVASALVRYYDNFYTAVPAPEPIVCYSTQTIEFRHNATVREDSTGVYYGDPPEYVGSRFKIPNAGGPAREARIAVIARRNDVESAADDDLTANATTDSTTVTAFATPRFLAVPR
jgi:hypothetical protein